jgi:hypothetical protein
MSAIITAVVGSQVVGGLIAGDAAGDAADAQINASNLEIAERRRQFDAIQKLLAPYVNAGPGALTAQRNLIGLGKPGTQAAAISALEASPQFQALTQQGENAILQNASATGNLRGGNVQGALAQFRPQILSQLIDQQFSRLGGITQLGQNSAVGVGNAGLQTANGVGGALQSIGAAQAGEQLAQGKALSSIFSGIGQGFGMYAGMGKF